MTKEVHAPTLELRGHTLGAVPHGVTPEELMEAVRVFNTIADTTQPHGG